MTMKPTPSQWQIRESSYGDVERFNALWQQYLLKDDDDFPDVPPCSKCGRIILCGVNKMCSDTECPKKGKGTFASSL
jgi:hypothetical protein